MTMHVATYGTDDFPPSRREILKSTTAFVAAAGAISTSAAAQPIGAANQPKGYASVPGSSL